MPQDFFVEETAELIKEKGVLSFFLLYFFLLLSYFITLKYSPQDTASSIFHQDDPSFLGGSLIA